jgi:ribonuclease HI
MTDDKATELGGREEHTTNNRMELMAVISAFESTPQEREMTIYTDSAYVVNGITRWVNGWKKNKWKTSQKEAVLNKDLWKKLDKIRKHKIIDWKLIKGHSGTAGNERCDVIATSFADKVPIVLYNGSRQRYGVDVNIKFPISNVKYKSKSKAHSYISMVDSVVEVHKTWEECKVRVNGVPNAKYKKSTSPANEEEIIKEFTE